MSDVSIATLREVVVVDGDVRVEGVRKVGVVGANADAEESVARIAKVRNIIFDYWSWWFV